MCRDILGGRYMADATPTDEDNKLRDTEILADSIIAYAKVKPSFLVPTQLLRELRSWIVDSITEGIKQKGWLHVSLLI